MFLTTYQVTPVNGGWTVTSTIGRTRYDGQVLTWREACEIKARLTARQARIYGCGRQLPQMAQRA